ncbi:hypothetical protein AQUCO_03400323v1 [Aquilegia coerulea]|uniref:Uncharacterized protein n=1 Tax=Aquilegia coerulea TaxID=218851 RepID=A0A2G5CYK9_AQUCA|nr:hypothetical protein AQUCO_03400323v1 [Aquilegia coerulea]
MKGEFEVVHGAFDFLQPHEQWDCNPIVFSSASNHGSVVNALPRPMIDSQSNATEKFEVSEWMDHVARQFSETATTNSFQTESAVSTAENFMLHTLGDCRPQKTARRHYGNGNVGEIQWNGHQTNSYEGNRVMNRLDEHGLNLLTLLLECAVAISVENLSEAHRMVLELTQMASPYGPSCAERVVAYFSMAMSSRIMNSWLGICTPLINHKSVHGAFQFYNNISPFIKFAHFTSNQAILEAFHQRDRVHIIDLDIMQGLQWPALFHILATRIEGPPHVRMTGMGSSMDLLVETGKQLSNFAKRLGLSFEFHPIAKKFGDNEVSNMVQVRRGETVAVHWLQHSLYDATGPDWKTMRLLQQLAPRVITLVEQDITPGGSFLDRFVGTLHYYSTIFDSLGASLSVDDPTRYRVEHGLLYREINNMLAIGGPTRSGEEKFNHWRSELARNCFVQVPMSGNSMAQAQLILNMCPPTHGYSLIQGDGTLRLGWKDTSLYTASSWTSHASV